MAIPLPLPMQRALALAQTSADAGEVPVGAVIMKDGVEIAAAANAMRASADPTAHAEMEAIRMAARVLGQERLEGCHLWVTLEPCAMCAGAIAHARIARVYYAAPDPKGGAVDHGPRFFTQPTCHHRPSVEHGIMETECGDILREFFRARR